MNASRYWASAQLIFFISLLFSCDATHIREAQRDITQQEIDARQEQIVTTELISEPTLTPVELASAPMPAAAVLPITPITAPMEFAKSVFDDSVNVDPWLANYVGSYGVMPTRFENHAPFFYSFDVPHNADILNDDDLAPDWFRHHEDDDN